jgi:hypothetical protein
MEVGAHKQLQKGCGLIYAAQENARVKDAGFV